MAQRYRATGARHHLDHEEAVRCFEEAAQLDQGCAMAHWGIAYAVGPNYNKDWDAFDAVELRSALRRAHESVERAAALAGDAAPVERDLIQALRKRFQAPEPVDDFTPWKADYADAMEAVRAAHPDDLDVATLCADAQMNLTAWQLWDVASGQPVEGARTRVISDNTKAIAADDRYVEHAGRLNFYALYRAHNHHFRIYGAMFAGQSQVALGAADALAASIPEELLRTEVPPMADWLEGFVPMKLHVLVRFGRWDDLIATPLPDDPDLYCTTTAMTHYAKGVAHAASGRVDEAEAERERFREAHGRVPESRYLFNNTCVDILAIASAMLDGEIDYRRGAYDTAFAHLRRAIELDDSLPYDEPWGWMQPTRHAYGALLLEPGEVEQAEAVYAADLGFDDTLGRACQHPNNVWSLHGYHECLGRLGKTGEARIIKQQLDLALARADVPIKASCFCRLQHAA